MGRVRELGVQRFCEGRYQRPAYGGCVRANFEFRPPDARMITPYHLPDTKEETESRTSILIGRDIYSLPSRPSQVSAGVSRAAPGRVRIACLR